MRDRDAEIDAFLWAAAVLCLLATIWLSLWAAPPGHHAFEGADKVQHFLAYAATSCLVLLAGVWRPGRGDGPLAPSGWWAIPLAFIVVGAAIEIAQSQMGRGRSAELGDWLAEVVAAAVAVVVVAGMRRHARTC